MPVVPRPLVRAAAETLIRASPERVWAIQTDLEGWPRWNGDVSSVELRGPLAEGTEFRWRAGGVRIDSVLREVEPPRRIAWTGRAPGVRAAHVWTFEPADGGVLARSEESLDGWLPRLLPGTMRRMLAASLERGVRALKTACEEEPPTGG